MREDGDTVLLPFLPGQTLAMLLEDVALDQRIRARAIELAVTALADFHSRGFTHGDAMAENVLVDVDAGVARWFDFETVHDSRRSIEWRRADDLRALLATCLLRSTPGTFSGTLQLVLGGYAGIGVKRIVREHCASVWHRALTFHLGQAPLSFGAYRALQRAVLSVSASPP